MNLREWLFSVLGSPGKYWQNKRLRGVSSAWWAHPAWDKGGKATLGWRSHLSLHHHTPPHRRSPAGTQRGTAPLGLGILGRDSTSPPAQGCGCPVEPPWDHPWAQARQRCWMALWNADHNNPQRINSAQSAPAPGSVAIHSENSCANTRLCIKTWMLLQVIAACCKEVACKYIYLQTIFGNTTKRGLTWIVNNFLYGLSWSLCLCMHWALNTLGTIRKSHWIWNLWRQHWWRHFPPFPCCFLQHPLPCCACWGGDTEGKEFTEGFFWASSCAIIISNSYCKCLSTCKITINKQPDFSPVCK